MKRPSLPIVGTCAAFLILTGGQAHAVDMFTVTPSPPGVSVLEGLPGIFSFTVKNVGAADITIKDVRFPANDMSKSFAFLSGDRNDEVFSTQLVNETNCEGKVLSTNGTCTFQQIFLTRDLDVAHSGTNVGIWVINNIVESLTDFQFGHAIAEVRDPGAVSTIPEPSALWLTGAGLACLALTVRRKGERTKRGVAAMARRRRLR